jgi:hypothetical protein
MGYTITIKPFSEDFLIQAEIEIPALVASRYEEWILTTQNPERQLVRSL